MECPAVRELLPEYALGTLDPDDRRLVDRHLAWCAGCRKELGHLEEGAAAVALGMRAPEPPSELEPRVLRAVRANRRDAPRRRPRAAALAAALAAVVATGSVAWAVSVADRLEQAEDDALAALTAVEEFQGVLSAVGGEGVRAADLSGARDARGRAVVYDGGGDDWVLVVGTGLPAREGPYRAYLTTRDVRVSVGRLALEGPPGSDRQALIRRVPGGVTGLHGVLVVDADDAPVLRGVLASSDG